MSVFAHTRGISLGALFLCLIAGLGLCSSEVVCRTSSGSRTRARVLRVEDHEHDQTHDGLTRSSEANSGSFLSHLNLDVPGGMYVGWPDNSFHASVSPLALDRVSSQLASPPTGRGPPVLS